MSPRGKVQNEQMRAEALDKITAASLDVFAEYGYHGTTMKQIARVSGLSYGLVYHYFPSKADLFFHLVDAALDKSSSTLKKGVAIQGSAWEKIKNLSELLVEEAVAGESYRYFLIILQAMTQGKGIEGLMEHIEKRSAIHYELVLPLVIQAQASGEAAQGDPVVLTAAYFSFVQGLSLLIFQEGGMKKKLTPELLINLLRNGQPE